MQAQTLTGKSLRLKRLSRRGDDRFLFVPLDHTISDGPIRSVSGFHHLIQGIVDGGADAIVVHKGRARAIAPELLRQCSLIVHLSASTAHAPDADAKVLVGEVADAVRLGADAVSVHVNIGSRTEATQLNDFGVIATTCEQWGIPLLAMMYARGPRISDPTNHVVLAHLAAIAADVGADIVKLPMTTPPDKLLDVVASSPLPVVVAGGAGTDADLAQFAARVIDAGCDGVAVGRRVFTSAYPERTVHELAAVIHGPALGSVLTPQPRMVGAQ